MLATLVHPYGMMSLIPEERPIFAHSRHRLVPRHHFPGLLHDPYRFEDTLSALNHAFSSECLCGERYDEEETEENKGWHVTSEVSRAAGDGRSVTHQTLLHPASGQRKTVTTHFLSNAPAPGSNAIKTTTTTSSSQTVEKQDEQQTPTAHVEVTGAKDAESFDALWEARAKHTAERQLRIRKEQERRRWAAALCRAEGEAAVAARVADDLQHRADAACEHAERAKKALHALQAAEPSVLEHQEQDTQTVGSCHRTDDVDDTSVKAMHKNAEQQPEQPKDSDVVVEDVDEESEDFVDVMHAAAFVTTPEQQAP